MAKLVPVSKKDLIMFFEGYLKFERVFNHDPRLLAAYEAWMKEGDSFMEGRDTLDDFVSKKGMQ